MNAKSGAQWKIAAVALSVLSACGAARGQSAGGGGGAASGASTSTAQPGRDTSPLNSENSLDLLPHPADKKEEKAFDKFKAVPAADAAKKVEAGELFLKAYPKSELARAVYPYIVVGYIQMGQMEKGMAAAQQDLTINPKDFRTMAVMSQALARTYNPAAANAADELAKADDYGKKALEGAATWQKPEGATDDEAFAKIKSDTEAMAHGGVGLVLLRQNKFEAAIPELEKATSLNTADQTNFYLLGMAEANTRRFVDAASAFAKCAALGGNLRATCTSAAADAKKNAGQ
jgi:tetratricopeptide (TPR) repeat protein